MLLTGFSLIVWNAFLFDVLFFHVSFDARKKQRKLLSPHQGRFGCLFSFWKSLYCFVFEVPISTFQVSLRTQTILVNLWSQKKTKRKDRVYISFNVQSKEMKPSQEPEKSKKGALVACGWVYRRTDRGRNTIHAHKYAKSTHCKQKLLWTRKAGDLFT